MQKNNIDNTNLVNRLKKMEEELERAGLLRDTLIRIVSHDIRGPMSNLKSVISLVREEQVGIEQAKEFMVTIDKGVDHTVQMLEELMEWGQAASRNKKVEQEEIILKDVIESIVKKIQPQIDDKKLDFEISGDIDAVCLFDKNAIRVVLRNLFSNAVKFTERGGQVRVKINMQDDLIVIAVSDTGIGIPDEMKANLFELKKDNKRVGTENEKSSGVGLFISKDLINQNDGTLKVEDNPDGKGTVFEFTMKRSKP
ncbi:HAMP domain-containing sensor histidine kinase [Ekhidna sp.]|uniref:sensor histidine kinase n=1 Tax=Ekhidna sp. TaxID=2608089 RepID=UPI0032EB26DF